VLWIFGDNGASAEGGLEGTMPRCEWQKKSIEERGIYDLLGSELYYNHYAASWAWALNSPYVGTKQDASHLGGHRSAGDLLAGPHQGRRRRARPVLARQRYCAHHL
jgi:arylsulfatase A-like enzyme